MLRLNVSINNSNTIIVHKLAFIRSRFGINVIDTGYIVCLHNIIGTQVTTEQQHLVNYIHTLILTRSNNLCIDGFSNNDINYIIDYIAISVISCLYINLLLPLIILYNTVYHYVYD